MTDPFDLHRPWFRVQPTGGTAAANAFSVLWKVSQVRGDDPGLIEVRQRTLQGPTEWRQRYTDRLDDNTFTWTVNLLEGLTEYDDRLFGYQVGVEIRCLVAGSWRHELHVWEPAIYEVPNAGRLHADVGDERLPPHIWAEPLDELQQQAPIPNPQSGVSTANLNIEPQSLSIHDEQLRRRCSDLLEASGDHDRAIQQACLVLENRVRDTMTDPPDTAIKVMSRAFHPNEGNLQLSTFAGEQVGALNIYNGMMGFFRNQTGHRIVEHWSREDAVRVVMFVDLLLGLVEVAAQAEQSQGST